MVDIPPVSHLVWSGSLINYRVYGSASPLAFEAKLLQIPENERQRIVAIFTDVLRASTTLVTIAAAGCPGIRVDVKPKNGEYLFEPPSAVGPWVYGGEENGQPVNGLRSGVLEPGVVGNSPLAVRAETFSDHYLRFFSTNGARALQVLTSAGLQSVYTMCLANVRATITAALAEQPERVWVVCGGFYGSASMEDCVACGRAIQELLNLEWARLEDLDDEAGIMHTVAAAYAVGDHDLADTLSKSQVGRLLTHIGHGGDIAGCVSGDGLDDEVRKQMNETVLRFDVASGLLRRVESE